MQIDIANIISAIGVIIAAWLSYNQYTRNKLTDLKVDQYKKNEDRKSYKRSENSGRVFGELWHVLFAIGADRVYIVQPHPLGRPCYFSVQFEVKKKGVEGMKEQVQNLPMAEIPSFSKRMAEDPFMWIDDIDGDVDDLVAKSLLSSSGCIGAIVQKLSSSTDWVGSIFCEFTNEMEIDQEEAKKVLKEAALSIQYILPEIYKPED